MGFNPCSSDTECQRCDHPMREHWTIRFTCRLADCPCLGWMCPNPHKDDGQ